MFCFRCRILGHRSSDCSIHTNNGVNRKVAATMGEGGRTGAPARDDRHTAIASNVPNGVNAYMDVDGDSLVGQQANNSNSEGVSPASSSLKVSEGDETVELY